MLCGKLARASEVIRVHQLVCHKSCLAKEFQTPESAACPDCGRIMKDVQLMSGVSGETPTLHACPECGCAKPLGGNDICSFCGLPIYEVQGLVEGCPRGPDYAYDGLLHCLHGFCAKSGYATGYLEDSRAGGLFGWICEPRSAVGAFFHDLGIALGVFGDQYWLFTSKLWRRWIRLSCLIIIMSIVVYLGTLALGHTPHLPADPWQRHF